MSYQIVRGDLGPNMTINLSANGSPVDVTTASSVVLHWVMPDGTFRSTSLVAVNATIGKFDMAWTVGDTTQVGTYFGHVIVTYGSVPETYPSDGSKIIWFVNKQVSD